MSDAISPAPRDVTVRSETIELCQFLKFGGLAATGGEAKAHISAGQVTVNGVTELQKGKKLRAGDQVGLDGRVIVVRVG